MSYHETSNEILQRIIRLYEGYSGQHDGQRIIEAYEFARAAHEQQRRATGEPTSSIRWPPQKFLPNWKSMPTP